VTGYHAPVSDDDDDVPRWSWIGWDSAGTVERLDDEAIETRFFCLVIPVRHGKSYYRYRTRDGGDAVVEIAPHRGSVLAGYLRTPLWLVALILGLPGIVMPRWSFLLPIAVALVAAAAVLTFGFGRLPAAERERRRLLQRVTGVGVPPELLSDVQRDETADDLADAWFRRHGGDWRDAIASGAASELLVAIAEYHRAPALIAQARANLIAVTVN
jgi:hypothetical protein